MKDLEQVNKLIDATRASNKRDLNLSDCDLRELSLLTSLVDLRKLNLCDSVELEDLSGLAALPKLEQLELGNCKKISDLTPLAKLSELEDLNLSNCTSLQDLSPLSGLVQLRHLDLEGCDAVSDLSSLADLTALKTLNLSNCKSLRDLSPISGLKQLRGLNLGGCDSLSDLSPLAGLKRLVSLLLDGCTSVHDFSPLAGLNGLCELSLEDLSSLQNQILKIQLEGETTLSLDGSLFTCFPIEVPLLPGLEKLELLFCRNLNDLSGVGKLTSLRDLYVEGCTDVADLTPLAGLPNLQRLSLRECVSISDLAPLAGLSRLTQLNFDGCEKLVDLSPLAGLNELREINLRGCLNIRDVSPLEHLNITSFVVSEASVSSVEQWKQLKATETRELKDRLRDACQNVFVTRHDCETSRGTDKGTWRDPIREDTIRGRVSRHTIIDPYSDEVFVHKSELITHEIARKIVELGLDRIEIRTPMHCECQVGVCSLCYGADPETGSLVEVGAAVGLVAAERLAMVTTQLELHRDNIALQAPPAECSQVSETRTEPVTEQDRSEMRDLPDVKNCLQRLIELFEAKRPKQAAIIAETDGQVELATGDGREARTLTIRLELESEYHYSIPLERRLCVEANQHVRAGDALTIGPMNPHDILRILGTDSVQRYLLSEIQQIYQGKGLFVDDRHLEIILSQMLGTAVRVFRGGDTGLAPGAIIDHFEFEKINHGLQHLARVSNAGDSDFGQGDVVTWDAIEEANRQIKYVGGTPIQATRARRGIYTPVLLGLSEIVLRTINPILSRSTNTSPTPVPESPDPPP